MSEERPPLGPPDPTLRFRVHTLLGATAVVAVLAALAGPFYRGQSPESQQRLLIYWTALLVVTVPWFWMRWRAMWQTPHAAIQIRFITRSGARSSRWLGSVAVKILVILAWIAFIGGRSDLMIGNSGAGAGNNLWLPLAYSLQDGILTSLAILWFVKVPILLCESGIAFGGRFAPWKFIRHAEWLPGAPGAMKFRRLDGDIYIVVTEKDCEAIEAFVRTKTTFIRPASLAHEKPPACAGG